MAKAAGLSAEIRNAILWLERQPGVTSVVQQKYQSTRHHNKVGTAKIDHTDQKHVRVRIYDQRGTKLLFVYAPQSPNRDRWVGQIITGNVAMPQAVATDVAGVKPTLPKPVPKSPEQISSNVERPKPVNPTAGQLFDVTPELAVKWLERNTRNRALRQSVVNRYAADMRAGRWLVTGDAIAFDRNGVVINGQHRLWAVFESGCTVQMMVVFDLAPEVVAVLDDHLKRNTQDVAKILRPGSTVTTVHASVAKMLLTTTIMTTSLERRAALERVTRQDELDSISRHWDAIEFAFRDCFRSRKVRSIVVTPVVTPMARAYYTQDAQRLREFGNVMLTGVMQGPDDKSAILLRNYLTRMAINNVKAAPDVIYRKAERALQAFLEKEPLSTLYEAASELFPLPEETVTGRKAKR